MYFSPMFNDPFVIPQRRRNARDYPCRQQSHERDYYSRGVPGFYGHPQEEEYLARLAAQRRAEERQRKQYEQALRRRQAEAAEEERRRQLRERAAAERKRRMEEERRSEEYMRANPDKRRYRTRHPQFLNGFEDDGFPMFMDLRPRRRQRPVERKEAPQEMAVECKEPLEMKVESNEPRAEMEVEQATPREVVEDNTERECASDSDSSEEMEMQTEQMELSEEEREALEKESATLIQAAFRGYMVRKDKIIPQLRRIQAIRKRVDEVREEFTEKIKNATSEEQEKMFSIGLADALTREGLEQLDSVITNGNSMIRTARKEATLYVQRLLEEVEGERV